MVVVPIVDGLVVLVVDVLTVVVDVLVPPRSTIRLKPTDGNEF